jgi:hypothetical protein
VTLYWRSAGAEERDDGKVSSSLAVGLATSLPFKAALAGEAFFAARPEVAISRPASAPARCPSALTVSQQK